jgi:sugar transferase (PEP-CTERM/EpsH1 system associated)
MKIKVLHVVLSLGTGGLENGVVNIINGSDANLFQIDVLCLRSEGELARRIHNEQTNVFFDSSRSQGLNNAISVIREANRNNQYHIIHTHGWATMLAGYLATLFSSQSLVINGEHGTLYFQTWRQRFMQKLLFNRMKINLSVSAALAKEISRRYNVKSERFIPILNGVDVEKFKPNAVTRDRVRRELGISKGQVIVGSVGRLVEVKNYPSLIRAFSKVLSSFDNIKLVLTGDGPDRKALERLANDLEISKDVIFLGRRDDVPDVMTAFDIFVLPSFREGLSNTVLEAMSSGLPVVVTDVGGNPEIVIENTTGYLFEVDDVEYLSTKLLSLCKHKTELKRLSEAARNHISENYSLNKMVDNYQAVYRKLMSDRMEG